MRGTGYQQSPNDGAMRHREFIRLAAEAGTVRVSHRLDWVTGTLMVLLTLGRWAP